MDEPAEDTGRDEERNPYFSCVFCHSTSPKPFKVCETCGSRAEEGEEPDPAESE